MYLYEYIYIYTYIHIYRCICGDHEYTHIQKRTHKAHNFKGQLYDYTHAQSQLRYACAACCPVSGAHKKVQPRLLKVSSKAHGLSTLRYKSKGKETHLSQNDKNARSPAFHHSTAQHRTVLCTIVHSMPAIYSQVQHVSLSLFLSLSLSLTLCLSLGLSLSLSLFISVYIPMYIIYVYTYIGVCKCATPLTCQFALSLHIYIRTYISIYIYIHMCT